MKVMEFNFGGYGARFIVKEFCLIIELCCGLISSAHAASSHRVRETFFGSNKLQLHNSNICEVFDTMTYEDDDDNVEARFAFFFFGDNYFK